MQMLTPTTRTAKRLDELKEYDNITRIIASDEIINFKNELKEIFKKRNHANGLDYVYKPEEFMEDIEKLIQEIESTQTEFGVTKTKKVFHVLEAR